MFEQVQIILQDQSVQVVEEIDSRILQIQLPGSYSCELIFGDTFYPHGILLKESCSCLHSILSSKERILGWAKILRQWCEEPSEAATPDGYIEVLKKI